LAAITPSVKRIWIVGRIWFCVATFAVTTVVWGKETSKRSRRRRHQSQVPFHGLLRMLPLLLLSLATLLSLLLVFLRVVTLL
jgi:hypothetical protein